MELNDYQLVLQKEAEGRRARIKFLRRKGKTLQQIGDILGISRERVRQILKGKDGKPTD